jgi:hypothetical protein
VSGHILHRSDAADTFNLVFTGINIHVAIVLLFERLSVQNLSNCPDVYHMHDHCDVCMYKQNSSWNSIDPWNGDSPHHLTLLDLKINLSE